MQKKPIAISIVVVVVLVAAISIYLFTRPMLLGNMNYRYTEQTTLTSNISFSAEAGDRIKFSFRSIIERGTLDIILYDSQGRAVYQLDRATELETFFTLAASDTYTLVAECDQFIGSFGLNVLDAN